MIFESPAKAKKINSFIGTSYVVKASVGHVRDLPPKKLGVDPEKRFEPEYTETTRGKKILKELKEVAKTCDNVYLAPDPDREGEAIAWHLFEALKKTVSEDHFYRVTYNEITKSAILAAFDNPQKIDMDRVNAQQARRVLDRWWVSARRWCDGRFEVRIVWGVFRRLRCGWLWSGSWKLRVSHRKPILPWGAEAQATDSIDPFLLKLGVLMMSRLELRIVILPGAVKSAEQLEMIQAERKGCVASFGYCDERGDAQARPPFITSTLQQIGLGALSFVSSDDGLAQKLYESG